MPKSSSSSASPSASQTNTTASPSTVVEETPPVNKKLVPIDDLLVDQRNVDEWMTGIGNLHGTVELRENVCGLHGNLKPVLEAFKKVENCYSLKLAEEIHKLSVKYATIARVCEKIVEKMETSSDQEIPSSSESSCPRTS
uniref:Uncharacterized protein n=1 Tax=Caenorhabditis japonica TaxID=281687 RepID=A0A8R1I5Z3_CAEJA